MDGYICFSTIVYHYSQAYTLAEYYKQMKDEICSQNMICEYFKVMDKEFYTSHKYLKEMWLKFKKNLQIISYSYDGFYSWRSEQNLWKNRKKRHDDEDEPKFPKNDSNILDLYIHHY